MFATYILAHILVAAIIPMFFAALLPITAISTLLVEKNWRNLTAALTQPLFKASLIIALLLLGSCLYAPYPDASLKDALQSGILLISFALLWGLKTNTRYQLTSGEQKLILSAILIILAAIIWLNYPVKQEWYGWERHSLNRQLAVFSLIIWPLSLYLSDPKLKNHLRAAFILLWVAVLTGASETAILMLLLGAIMYSFLRFAPLPGKWRTLCFSLAAIAIIITPMLIASLSDPWVKQQIVTRLGEKAHHYQIWLYMWEQTLENLPLGIGIGTTPILNTEEAIAIRGFKAHHPHNFLIEFLLELGVLGGVMALAVLWAAIALFHRTARDIQPETGAALIAIFTLYSTTFSLWQEWRMGFVAFALILFQRLQYQNPDQPAAQK